MPRYNFITYNVKGMGGLVKRKKIMTYLNKQKVDVAFLQESHLLFSTHEQLKSGWVGKVFHSSFASNSRGVVILIRHNVLFLPEEVKSDKNGRYIFVRGLLDQVEVIFLNCYCPNHDDPKFINDLTLMVAKFKIPIFWGGDFNCILDANLDRSSTTNYSLSNMSIALAKNTQELGLYETWRTIHPNDRDFSFYSPVHNTYSRIDFFFVSSSFVSKISKCVYLARILSDHSALLFSIDFDGPPAPSKTWRFNTSLLANQQFIEFMNAHLDTFSAVHQDSTVCPLIVWDTLKAYIRGMIIAFSSSLKAKTKDELQYIEQQIKKLEKHHCVSKDPAVLCQLDNLKMKYNNINTHFIELNILKTKQRSVEQGEMAGKLLAWQIKKESEDRAILRIKGADGCVIMDPVEINDTFKSFYSELYESECHCSEETLNTFLKDIPLPSLTTERRSQLDKDITSEEILKAMYSLQKGKAPGLDGLPVEFYRQFSQQLMPFFHSMISTSLQKRLLPQSLYVAVIILLKKKDKDPLLCASYRPVSLLNVDYKIITKILTLRLESVVSNLIHSDQTGFVQGRLLSDNIRRYFDILFHTKDCTTPMVAISIDAEKAFDRLEWEYLIAILSRYNFGPIFISWIRIIYSLPMAIIKTNNQHSSPFKLSRGTRQGCPMSPSLFALAIEALAAIIRSHNYLQGIKIGSENHVISLYADDILLYLRDPLYSIPILFTILDQFGDLSGYKVNQSKTEIMPISKFNFDSLKDKFNLKWSPDYMKYLGIYIPNKIDDTYHLNYSPLIEKVTNDLKRMNLLPISLMGRTNIIKMSILPKFLFLFQNIPFSPPLLFFKKMQSIFSSFIWESKSPRISQQVLQLPYNDGGLNLPNLNIYFLAAQLTQIRHGQDWNLMTFFHMN